jgi:O-antigen ligase
VIGLVVSTKVFFHNPIDKKGVPFVILIVFLFFEYLRIQDAMLPFLAPLKIPMFLLIGLFFVLCKKFNLLKKDLFFKCIVVLILEMAIWIPFAVNGHFAYGTTLTMFMTMISMFAMIVIIDDENKLISVINYWVIINFILALWVITHGGKGPGGFVADENDVCVVLVTAFPLAFCLARNKSRSKLIKAFYYIICFSIAVAVVFTSSRGGFLGFVAMVLMMLWYSQKKWRNIFLMITLIGVLIPAVISFLPEGYVDDMESISDTEDNTRNLRLLHWTTAWEILKDNPVFGIGPGNYPWRSHEYFHKSYYYDPNARNRSARQSHSLYFTLIPELGSVGIILFFLIFTVLIARLKSNNGSYEQLQPLKFSLIAALAGIFISGAFISILYYPILWHFLGLSLCTLNTEGGQSEAQATNAIPRA